MENITITVQQGKYAARVALAPEVADIVFSTDEANASFLAKLVLRRTLEAIRDRRAKDHRVETALSLQHVTVTPSC